MNGEIRSPDERNLFGGAGEMAARMRAIDWSKTSLGESSAWPQSLRTSVSLCIDSRAPVLLWWGAEFVTFYNDAYIANLGSKHPHALGSPANRIWPEIWGTVGPELERIQCTGEPLLQTDRELFLDRNGFLEECYFTYAYAPVRAENGQVGGIFVTDHETTARILTERRQRTLHDFAANGRGAENIEEVCKRLGGVLAGNARDVPFAALYLFNESHDGLDLVCATEEPACALTPAQGTLEALSVYWPLREALQSQQPIELDQRNTRIGAIRAPVWDEPLKQGLILPLRASGATLGVLIVGINPRLVLDDSYRTFLDLLTMQVAGSIGDALAYRGMHDADRRKNEFLAILAHELRNPLAPIRNAASILAAPGLAASQLSWCQEVIQRQTEHMALLLDDLLDISRVTMGRLQLKKEIVEVSSLIKSAVEAADPLLKSRQHRLTLDLPATAVLLEVDPLRIAQVLANLLTNAAKYTDPGGDITLSARLGDHALIIKVRDNGIGLDSKDIDQIFVMFSQVDSVFERSQGGLGIGLALVKGLVELHGGTLSVESPGLGRGSEFTVLLPGLALSSADALPAPSPTPPPKTAWRMLIADDNRDAAQSLALLFELSGHEVYVAHDGEEAVKLASQVHPRVAFIDIGMPLLNGYQVAEQLRRQPDGPHMHLVALTGWGQEENKRRALESGFDHHVTKPVDPARLERLLENLIPK